MEPSGPGGLQFGFAEKQKCTSPTLEGDRNGFLVTIYRKNETPQLKDSGLKAINERFSFTPIFRPYFVNGFRLKIG
jgi:hypothetical protein